MKKLFASLLLCLTLVSCSSTPTKGTQIFDEQNNQKAHVILLAGGEDALGFSYTYHLLEHDGVSEQKFKEYQEGYDNVLISYKNMLNTGLVHKEETKFVKTKMGQGKAANEGIRYGNIGPELGLAEYLSNFYPNEQFYIIKFAGGGDSVLPYAWNPNGGTYYELMTSFFNKQLNKLIEANINFDIPSFCFIQGEADAEIGSKDYEYHFSNFVEQVKLDYKQYTPLYGMSFIDVGLSNFYITEFRNINNAKQKVMDLSVRDVYIDPISIGLTNDNDNKDRRHFDAKSQIKLGHILADTTMNKLIETPHISEQISFTNNKNFVLDNNAYQIEMINKGIYSKGHFALEKNSDALNVKIDVLDEFVTKDDGIALFFNLESFPLPQVGQANYKLFVNAKNEVKFYYLNLYTQEYVLYNQTINSEVMGLIDDSNNNIGYHVEISIPMILDTHHLFVDFSLINEGEISSYKKLYSVSNKAETYMHLEGGQLKANTRYEDGQMFGSLPTIQRTSSWNLSLDDNNNNIVSINEGLPLNYAFLKDSKSNTKTFTAQFRVNSMINIDMYPKFGILIVDENFNGLFYFVDAYSTNGYNFVGKHLGYCLVESGQFVNYVDLGEFVMDYLSNNVELSISRNLDNYTFSLNGQVVFTGINTPNLGLNPSYFGINTFNTNVIVSNYVLS